MKLPARSPRMRAVHEAGEEMTDQDDGSNGDGGPASRRSVNHLFRFIGLAVAVAAVVKELRTPAEHRAGHGTVAGVIPYDFRRPTLDRAKQRLWNSEGPLVSPQVFGVGWTLNLGALFARIRRFLT